MRLQKVVRGIESSARTVAGKRDCFVIDCDDVGLRLEVLECCCSVRRAGSTNNNRPPLGNWITTFNTRRAPCHFPEEVLQLPRSVRLGRVRLFRKDNPADRFSTGNGHGLGPQPDDVDPRGANSERAANALNSHFGGFRAGRVKSYRDALPFLFRLVRWSLQRCVLLRPADKPDQAAVDRVNLHVDAEFVRAGDQPYVLINPQPAIHLDWYFDGRTAMRIRLGEYLQPLAVAPVLTVGSQPERGSPLEIAISQWKALVSRQRADDGERKQREEQGLTVHHWILT